MTTNKFADDLPYGIKDMLSLFGIPENILNQLDIVIYLILILVIAIIAERIVHSIILRFSRKVLKYKKLTLLSNLFEYNVPRKVSSIIPPNYYCCITSICVLPWFRITLYLRKITWNYFFVVLFTSINAALSSIDKAMMKKGYLHDKPIKGFIQLLQVLLFCMIAIVIISILINKPPLNLIIELGAFAAVLMLIFKDKILGFVAGELLSENDMIHIGDWIEIKDGSANGIVIDISLTIVKVQNFDNTIVTIPPYTFISQEFINWRGMEESIGRRIMREFNIMLDFIKPCSADFLERMKSFDADLGAF